MAALSTAKHVETLQRKINIHENKTSKGNHYDKCKCTSEYNMVMLIIIEIELMKEMNVEK